MKATIAATLILLLNIPLVAGPLPKEWTPELATAREWIKAELEAGPSQQAMNRLTGALAELSDAELALVYLQLWAALEPAKQRELQAEQTRWLSRREKAAEEGIESEGGSLAPTEANIAFDEFTQKRITELRLRLKELEESS